MGLDRLKRLKPTTPGQRFRTIVRRDGLSKNKPEKNLTVRLKKHAGRNNFGRITCRHRGGGSPRKYRIISDNLPKGNYKVINIQYDPNRTGRIALITSEQTQEKHYILAPMGLQSDDVFSYYEDNIYTIGSRMNLNKIPIGKEVYNISKLPNGPAVYAKAAGNSATLVGIDKVRNRVKIQLQSKALLELHGECAASIGIVSNIDNKNIVHGKAGISRHRGRRPSVRGVAMNPCDHPMGGGEGKSSGGGHPVTPWGKKTKGFVTVRGRKNTKHIIRSRKTMRGSND